MTKHHIIIRDINGVELIIKRNDIRKAEPDLTGVTTIYFYKPRIFPIKVGCTVSYLYNSIMYPST